jgi:alkanesulfonate monooxygenase SsuD/methylene tetrahydromethanopterin reductase-like flavin-dependent oxidoreductase (luciferase family)
MQFDPNGVRVDRLEESLQILRSSFSQEIVSFAGEHYRLHDHQHYPPPAQPGGPPIMIGAGKPRMLRLAGRYADIVSLLTVSVSSGRLVADVAGRRASAIQEQVAHIADGAKDRFSRIELSMGPLIEITKKPIEATRGLIETNEWRDTTIEDVHDMPGIYIGSIDAICNKMIQRREELGISYFIIPDRQLDAVAPIVARLRGG